MGDEHGRARSARRLAALLVASVAAVVVVTVVAVIVLGRSRPVPPVAAPTIDAPSADAELTATIVGNAVPDDAQYWIGHSGGVFALYRSERWTMSHYAVDGTITPYDMPEVDGEPEWFWSAGQLASTGLGGLECFDAIDGELIAADCVLEGCPDLAVVVEVEGGWMVNGYVIPLPADHDEFAAFPRSGCSVQGALLGRRSGSTLLVGAGIGGVTERTVPGLWTGIHADPTYVWVQSRTASGDRSVWRVGWAETPGVALRPADPGEVEGTRWRVIEHRGVPVDASLGVWFSIGGTASLNGFDGCVAYVLEGDSPAGPEGGCPSSIYRPRAGDYRINVDDPTLLYSGDLVARATPVTPSRFGERWLVLIGPVSARLPWLTVDRDGNITGFDGCGAFMIEAGSSVVERLADADSCGDVVRYVPDLPFVRASGLTATAGELTLYLFQPSPEQLPSDLVGLWSFGHQTVRFDADGRFALGGCETGGNWSLDGASLKVSLDGPVGSAECLGGFSAEAFVQLADGPNEIGREYINHSVLIADDDYVLQLKPA